MNNISLRDACNEDSQYIIKLIFDIWLDEKKFKVTQEDYPDLYDINKHYAQTEGIFLVATINDRIIGTAAFSRLNSKQLVLKRMFIKKEYRRMGVGQLLLEELFVRAGIAEFYLSTNDKLGFSAQQFYKKNGFVLINKSELPRDAFPLFYENDIFMLKKN